MARHGIISKPSNNSHTESRRVMRVNALIKAGWSVDKIREEMQFTLAMINYYFDKATSVKNNKIYRERFDLIWKENHGVQFGSKIEPYFDSNEFSELEAWETPKYSFDDLSESEKEFYDNFNNNLDYEESKNEKSREVFQSYLNEGNE